MNKKFYFGLFMVIAGSSTLGAIATYAFSSHKKHEKIVDTRSLDAVVHALKVIGDKVYSGDYDGVANPKEAIRSDYEFYKIAYLEQ